MYAATLNVVKDDELDAEGIAKRIKLARLAAGFRTQKDFADAVGVHVPNANRWERGKVIPETAQLAKICLVTGTTAEEILYGRRTSDAGGGAMRTESLRRLFLTDEGKRLSNKQRYALGELLDGVEVPEHRIRAALDLLSLLEEKKPSDG
jgi:transcriptional regulator with XRE-family HTH domain